LFSLYTRDFAFAVTRYRVKLLELGVRFVSRSEAKRLMRGLDKFQEVILDFTGVAGVGQGFADEVFRVWGRAHPATRLVAENMNPAVSFMIERARRDSG
jgi:formamidopyrimidine-DNA glycosylase